MTQTCHNYPRQELFQRSRVGCVPGRGEGGGVLQEKLGQGCAARFSKLTLFMAKICDIPYPFYDLNKTLKS